MTFDFAVLVLAAFVTSIISGVIGMIGGILLLMVMAEYFPPSVLIPLHGIVQLASNSARVTMNRREVHWRVVGLFAVGAALGAWAGSSIVVALGEREFKLLLAAFILLMTWTPKIPGVPEVPGKFVFLGALATFASLFVGATGPILGPFFLRSQMNRIQIIASQAGCQMVLHLAKVATFVTIGFRLGDYVGLAIAMSAVTIAGNRVGKSLLNKIPEDTFRRFFKATITLLAMRMLWVALQS